MRIKEIDFDERLLNARQQGSLVVFAGAGVSKGKPSNYPDFKGLTREIARLSGQNWPRREPIEHFLGRLDTQKLPVHQQIAERLSTPNSRPTSIHKDLLRLFGIIEKVRIVTTNFDRHFETASTVVFDQLPDVFKAPALPLGNDFTGIVYLHGSVEGDPLRMVLTDKDFGRAYLTEGWATRFLQTMFSQYTVLFVGYSHNDPVMHYLSRGLPSENTKQRFALVHAADDLDEWRYRGIEPLPYPCEGKSGHSKLSEAVARWVELAYCGALDTEKQIKELVENPPPLDPEKQDYLVWAIRDQVAVRFFTRHAKSIEWLVWAADRGFLKALFSKDNLSAVANELAQWIGQHYAVHNANAVFAVMERNGLEMNPVLSYEIVQTLAYSVPEPGKEVISRWVPFLLQCKAANGYFEYTELLKRAVRQGALAAAVQLFHYLTCPYLALEKSLSDEEEDVNALSASCELSFRGDYPTLNEVWREELKPRMSEIASFLWPGLIQNVNHAYELLNSWEKADPSRDPLSWHRRAIETHKEDCYHKLEDVLIDAARDCLEWTLVYAPRIGDSWVESLSSMTPIMLRRLAIHGIAYTDHLDSDAKVRWLINYGLQLNSELKHEVFQLLRKTYQKATADVRDELLDAAEKDICSRTEGHDDAGEVKDREMFHFLDWLSRADPSCKKVSGKLEEISSRYPQLKPLEYPDFDHVVTIKTWVGPRSPKAVDDLLIKRPTEWLEYFLTFQGDPFDGPDRSGLLHTIGEAVQRDFIWGRELAELLIDRGESTSDLWPSVIRGWNGAVLSGDQWEYVLSVLNNDRLARHLCRNIAVILKNGMDKEETGIPFRLFSQADEVALAAWRSCKDETETETNDWLTRAFNRPGGDLTMFWLHALSRTRKESKQKDKGIDRPYRERLDMIVTDTNLRAAYGRVILCHQLAYLYAVDPDWTRENLFPLMDWGRDVHQARQAWDGWLSWWSLNDPLVSELLPYYRQAFSYISCEFKEKRHRLIEHVVVISLHLIHDPLASDWVQDFLQAVQGEDRIGFASQIGNRLMGMDDEIKTRLWKRWLCKYWETRNHNSPVSLSNDECIEMVEWICDLEPVFPEAVEVVCAGPVPDLATNKGHTNLFHRLNRQNPGIAEGFPEATAKLLIHLTTYPLPQLYRPALEGLTERLISVNASSSMLHTLCDQLAAVGCPNAMQLSDRILA